MHDLSLQEFFDAYCDAQEPNFSDRWHFAKPLRQVYEWARYAGAAYLLVGGSFVSAKEDPGDVDLLVVFDRDRSVEKCPENVLIREIRMDIQYLSTSDDAQLQAFIYLLAHSKAGEPKGVVRIPLSTGLPRPDVPSLKPALYEIVRDVYEGRTQIIPYARKGMLVPIHGVNTSAPWLSHFSLIATNAGWGMAPFVYGREWVTTLGRIGRREKLAEQFHQWLVRVRAHYNGPVGIFAHSLGSYIFAKYLELAGDHCDEFCGVVLAGSILNTGYDWRPHLDSGRISAVCNTASRRDTWVARMPDGGRRFMRDPLYGNAGGMGFKTAHSRLVESRVDTLNHVNMFQDDAVKRWLTFFELALKLQETTPEIRAAIDIRRSLQATQNSGFAG